MSNEKILDKMVEEKILGLFESILDLTRVSAKEWIFENRSSASGMATFGMKNGKLNVYFDGASFLLDVKFPEGDYVYIQKVHGPLKGKINAVISEICDVLLDSPEYSEWLDGSTVDDRISSSIGKMQTFIVKKKERLFAEPDEIDGEIKPEKLKKPSFWQRFCGR